MCGGLIGFENGERISLLKKRNRYLDATLPESDFDATLVVSLNMSSSPIPPGRRHHQPPRGGWDCREFTDPFSNLPPFLLQHRTTTLTSQDSDDDDAVPETPQTNETSANNRLRSGQKRNGVAFFENDDDEEEEEEELFAANALLIAPTSRKDCGVTASLLFARCVRECVLSSAEEEYAEMSVNGNNEENETDSRRKKKGELFLPKALFVCHRDALESKTFAAPSVALADAKGTTTTTTTTTTTLTTKDSEKTSALLPEEYITSRAAKRVSIKYASTDEDVVKIMSALHVLPVEELPSIIAVCDVSAFSDRSDGCSMGGSRERTASHARVCAAIVEAARYSMMARRRAMLKSSSTGRRSRMPMRCKVVVSERKDDMEDATMLAKKEWEYDSGMCGMMLDGGEETKYYNRSANAGTAAANNSSFHPLTYATKRWFERVFVVQKKDGYEEEVIEVGKVGGGAYEVIDCATGAKSTYIATLGVN